MTAAETMISYGAIDSPRRSGLLSLLTVAPVLLRDFERSQPILTAVVSEVWPPALVLVDNRGLERPGATLGYAHTLRLFEGVEDS